jgi:hypothetical protein
MNRLDFAKAGTLAVAALIVFLLPHRWRALRWVSIGFALVSMSIVVHLSISSVNYPPWQPAWLMMWPVLVSLVAIALSLRTLLKK